MSYTYIAEIKSNSDIIDTTQMQSLGEVSQWANKHSIIGDLVVISEGYVGSDGILEVYDHVASWRVD